jgi:outer membrane protein TolC
LYVGGCSSQKPILTEQPEVVAANAIGIADAIVFDTTGGSVDMPGESADPLSLEEALRLSLQADSRIQSALSRVRMAQAESSQSRLWPNPILSVVLKFPEQGKTTIDLGIAADLISILKQPGQISIADNRLRSSAAEVVIVVLDVVAEVQERYLAIQSLDGQLAVLEERRGISDQLIDLAQARLEAGEGTQLDITTLQAQQVELETEIAEHALTLREERLALARLIGRPSSDANWKVASWSPTTYVSSTTETKWIELALSHRPEVESRRWELAALGDELSQTGFSPFDGTEVGVEAEKEDGWSVGPGVAVPLPLFDMGQAQRARASAAVIEARHQLTEVQRQVIEETRAAYVSFNASQAILARVRDELIPLQEKRLVLAEAQYKAGLTDITEFFLAEQDLRAVRVRMIELQQTNSVSLVRLERAVGGAGVASDLGDPNPTTAPSANGSAVPQTQP